MKYTKIPTDTFQKLQLNAGIIVESFTPSTGAFNGILGATSGGVTFSAKPTYEDWGEDVDNCPKNMLELKKLVEWEVVMSGKFATVSAELAKLLLGAGDVSGETYALTSDTAVVAGKTYYTRTGTDPNYTYTVVTSPSTSGLSTYYERVSAKIVPRNDILTSDFEELWWVGDYSDKNGDVNGGYLAIKMMNVLSTGGFEIKTEDKSKSTMSFEFTAHYSQSTQDTVPFEMYLKTGTSESA